jgi:hypothetical protein
MKRKIIHLIAVVGFAMIGNGLLAQVPPPPPGGHGQGGNQPAGGGAPIGSGIGILLALGAAYGGKKIYQAWKTREEQLED